MAGIILVVTRNALEWDEVSNNVLLHTLVAYCYQKFSLSRSRITLKTKGKFCCVFSYESNFYILCASYCMIDIMLGDARK